MPSGAVTASFSVTDTVQNQGSAAAGASTARYYLSADTVKGSTDKLLTGSRAVPTLAAGVSATGTVTLAIPAGTAAGSYYLIACADDTALVKETLETNNCLASQGTLQVAPDLRLTSVSNPPASALVGANFVVTTTVQNAGSLAAGASTTRYYLSTDAVQDSADLLLTGVRAVPMLAAGASSAGSVTVSIPLGTAAGSYYLIACADDTKVIVEADEANNCLASSTKVQVVGPDLIVSALTAPSGAVTASFSVTDTVQNQGSAAAGASTVRYYLSANTLKDSADKLLTGSHAVPSLAPGALSSGSAKLSIPAGTAAGSYYVLACADDTALVKETVETNNCLASQNTIQVGADLRVTALGSLPASVLLGGHFTLTDTVQNQGSVSAGASVTRYYLSADAVQDSADVLLGGSRSVPGLAPMGSSAGSVSVSVPATIATGSYYVIACADDTQLIAETNEANNCTASPGQVQVVGPDLIVTSVTVPASARVGVAFKVSDTVQNQGSGSAGLSYTRYYLSADTVKDSADKLLSGMRAIYSLGAGASSSGFASVSIPAGTAVGSYYVIACADDTALVKETVETNNCLASGMTMAVGP